MLTLSNSYFLQSHTELTSYSMLEESHVQAYRPYGLSYPCQTDHVQLTHTTTPTAPCYSFIAQNHHNTPAVFVNFPDSQQTSAVRSHDHFEDGAGYKSSRNQCYSSQSKHLPRRNRIPHSLFNSKHLNKLKSLENIASTNSRGNVTLQSKEKTASFNMVKLNTSAGTLFYERFPSPDHSHDNNSGNPREEIADTQKFDRKQLQAIHEENISCREELQRHVRAEQEFSTYRKLNHSIASILNMSAENINNQEVTTSKDNQETVNFFERSNASDILMKTDAVDSKQNRNFDKELYLTLENTVFNKNVEALSTLGNEPERVPGEFRAANDKECTKTSTNSSKCDSFHGKDIQKGTKNTTEKHSCHVVPQSKISSLKTNCQEAAIDKNTNVLQNAIVEISNFKNTKWSWPQDLLKPDFPSENLQINAVPFIRTTSASILPPFHTLSPLHRKGAYDNVSAFNQISQFPASVPRFPNYADPYGNWTGGRNLVPQNIGPPIINRLVNTNNALYSSSGMFPKCISNYPRGNNLFGDSGRGQQNSRLQQRQGCENILNSSAAASAREIAPANMDKWMAWFRQTEELSLKSSQFEDRISSRGALPPRYHCDFCNKTYSTFGGLSKHRQFHCSQHVKKEFSCKVCNRAYSSMGALKMHIRTHTLPCKCQECGKAFSRPWLLQGHLRTHTGEKPFKCSHCGRAFADRSNLRAHLQTHAEIKRYACSKCCKTFSRMSLLTKHTQGNCLVNLKHR